MNNEQRKIFKEMKKNLLKLKKLKNFIKYCKFCSNLSKTGQNGKIISFLANNFRKGQIWQIGFFLKAKWQLWVGEHSGFSHWGKDLTCWLNKALPSAISSKTFLNFSILATSISLRVVVGAVVVVVVVVVEEVVDGVVVVVVVLNPCVHSSGQ